MKLTNPVIITPSLLPGIQIGDAYISIAYAGSTKEGRQRYEYHIDTPLWHHEAKDLKSGCQGGNLQEGLESVLSFLGAAAESYPDGDNADLFPEHVTEWAHQHSDEIGVAQFELEENSSLIEE